MQIHRVRGGTLREALLRARSELGDDALVVHQELIPGGGVTLAVRRGAPARDPAARPRAREVAEKLARAGASSELLLRVCSSLDEGSDSGQHVLDQAAQRIGALFPTARLERIPGHTRLIALAGTTGVGKTTSLVKLALRMQRAGRRVELATL